MADEIIRLDYSAEDIGDNIDEVRTARGTFDTLDDRLDNIEGGGPSPSNPIASNCVSPMTGYSKSSSSTPGNISTSDTLNAAIGKLEKRTELNENNILLKADKISFGFSGNPNPAVYVKDWDFVPDGTYLLTYICSQDASTRRGVSVYMFTKYTTNHIVLFTPVVEVSGAIITSCVASGSAGAETITFTMAQRGYHTAAAIQIQAF